jgi:phosphonate transport system substrate-binding protein
MALPHPIRFGVSRSHGGPKPQESAATFCAVLGARLKVAVEPAITADYDELTSKVLEGKIQLAWMSAIAHTRATRRGCELTAVSERQSSITYRSALLVRTDSVFVGLNGLRGVRAAWTDPSSAGGHVFPRLYVQHAGIDPRRDFASEKFYGSTRAALDAVAEGQADLCACYVRSASSDPDAALADVDRVLPGARESLRVIGVTEQIPPDGIVLTARLDPLAQAQLRDVLLDLHSHPAGRSALEQLMQADRLRGVTNDVLRVIARLRPHVQP